MIRVAIFSLACLLLAATAQANVLTINNQTNQDIINILVKNPAREFYLRLDLLPYASDKVENPDCKASLRVDTGLEFWFFDNIDLARARQLTFCAEHPVCLQVQDASGIISHVTGKLEELIPNPGSKPVCELDSFHPDMAMTDVCQILPEELARDDNGALITGLGFASLPWAARFVPSGKLSSGGTPLLEHLELRRRLDPRDAKQVLEELFKQGYSLWQAEFPGREIDADGREISEAALNKAIDRFCANEKPLTHKNHAAGEKCAEASLLLAPKNMLPELENSDEPASDVQIFTLVLRPCTNVLLLDVAAYRKQ